MIAEDLQGEDLGDVLEMHSDAYAWWVLPKGDGYGERELRGAADKLLDGSGADLAVIASDKGLVVKATKDAVSRGAHAGQLVGKLAAAAGGKGGGRPDMAQAGIQNPDAALEALDTAF